MPDPARQIGAIALSIGLSAMLIAIAPLRAQTPLPATPLTGITASQLPSANPRASHGEATLNWDGYLLQINANGQSLSEVLREIALRAAVHITGNPPEDRLYGTYGPAPLVNVLTDLVSGLPVNMLFVERTGSKPADLTFTARNGAATPPSDSSQQQQFAQGAPYQPSTPPPQPPAGYGTGPDANGNAGPGSAAAGANQASGEPAATTQPGDTGSTPASPNGVKTPQEIFQQLQRLRANSGAQK